MKIKFSLSLLIILSLIFTVLAGARLEKKSFLRSKSIEYPINKSRASKKNNSIILSSNGSCAGSELTVNSSKPVSSIVWLLDGVSILEQSIAKQDNGLVVAGGNGTGNAANQLFNPNRLFVDKEGNLYIPDMANNRIQKWAPGATFGITIAGGNGAGSAANQFNRPTSVAIDINGNIYVADQNNSRVQKWAPGANSGTTIASSLNTPTGVFIDHLGNLYVSEQNAQCVRKFTGATGVGVIVAGGNGYGNSANQLASPTGIFVDSSGNLYICDTDNSRVQKWALGSNSGTTVARVSGNPLGVYVDGSNNIYVTDYTGFNVQKFIPGSINGVTIAGGNGQGNNPNQITPVGVWMDKYNNLYVSDFLNGRIIKFGNVYTGTYATNKGGTYTAKITTTDGEILTSNAIVIQDNLTPKITIQSNANVVCNQFIPIFTATIENGGSAPVIQWKINNVNVPNANSSTFKPTILSGGDVVSCDLTNVDNCVTTALVHSNAIGVTSATETPQINITSDVNNICEGSKITFSATSTNAGLSPSYIWKVNNNLVTGNGSSFESSALNNNDEVTCEVVSNAQYCQTSANAISNLIIAKVNPILTPSIFISKNLTKIYNGSIVQFSAAIENEGINPSYQWFINGLPNGTNSNEFTTSGLIDGDEVSCELTVSSLCVTSNIVISNLLKINVIKEIIVNPPNAFSPNGDGINDFWIIDELKYYPKSKVHIYNRFGVAIFQSVGYIKPWTGEYKNIRCNPGVYYYVINIDNNKVVSGSVMILK